MPVNFGETFDVDGSCGTSRLYQVEQDAKIIEYVNAGLSASSVHQDVIADVSVADFFSFAEHNY